MPFEPPPTFLLLIFENIDDVIVIFNNVYLLSIICALELQAEFVISMAHSVFARVSHCSSRSA